MWPRNRSHTHYVLYGLCVCWKREGGSGEKQNSEGLRLSLSLTDSPSTERPTKKTSDASIVNLVLIFAPQKLQYADQGVPYFVAAYGGGVPDSPAIHDTGKFQRYCSHY